MKALALLLVLAILVLAGVGCGGGSGCVPECGLCQTDGECCDGGAGGTKLCVLFNDGISRCAPNGAIVCPQ